MTRSSRQQRANIATPQLLRYGHLWLAFIYKNRFVVAFHSFGQSGLQINNSLTLSLRHLLTDLKTDSLRHLLTDLKTDSLRHMLTDLTTDSQIQKTGSFIFCDSFIETSLNIKPSGYYMYHHVYHSQILRSAHTVYLCVLCASQNKQRLFHCTTLTDWFV
jgi:hypothetical protein